MRAYRYRYGKRKKTGRKAAAALLLLTAFCALRATAANFGETADTLEVLGYEELVWFFMPAVGYDASESDPARQLLGYFILRDETGESGKEEAGNYSLQTESEFSYEAILAKEAADENYVDEATGQLILSGETAQEAANGAQTADGAETANGAQTADGAETASKAQTADGADAAVNETQTADGAQEAAETSAAGQTVAESAKQVAYSLEKLADFDYLIQNFYQVDNTTTITGEQLNAETLLSADMSLSQDASAPQILIYHTHSQEGYADSVEGDSGTTVVGVGDELTRILTEEYGLNVIHHTGEYDVEDRDHAYSKAGPALEQILAENPSIEVVIDLHRDGVREDTRLVTEIDGVPTAQIMFFNGLSRTTSLGDIDYLYNPYIQDNLAFSFQMQLAAAEYYPGFTRRIYLKGYRYNMHYCPKTLLIEVGAQTNTVAEAKNAMGPLAAILNYVLTN